MTTEQVSADESFVTCTKQGDLWVIDANTSVPIRVMDRKLANDIFQMVRYAHAEGRDDAFRSLRALIGA